MREDADMWRHLPVALRASDAGRVQKCRGLVGEFCIPERNNRKESLVEVFEKCARPFVYFSLPNIEAFSEVVC